jgi:hypothetical protein
MKGWNGRVICHASVTLVPFLLHDCDLNIVVTIYESKMKNTLMDRTVMA